MSIKDKLKSFFERFLNFFYPPACIGCDAILAEPGALCPECLKLYEEEKMRQCGICFQPLQACKCGIKGKERHDTTHLYKVFSYRPNQRNLITNKLIYAIKDSHLYYPAEFVAEELYQTVKLHGLKLSGYEITYIPASKKRMIKKGYNQLSLISEMLGKRLGLAVSPVLYRTRETKPQKELKEQQRVENVKDLFRVEEDESLDGRKFILIDDICTTGSTLISAGKALREAGASRVIYLVIASTVSKT